MKADKNAVSSALSLSPPLFPHSARDRETRCIECARLPQKILNLFKSYSKIDQLLTKLEKLVWNWLFCVFHYWPKPANVLEIAKQIQKIYKLQGWTRRSCKDAERRHWHFAKLCDKLAKLFFKIQIQKYKEGA